MVYVHHEVWSLIQITSDMKERYDIRAEVSHYAEGDLGWLFNPQRKWELFPKLQRAWNGTYILKKRINDISGKSISTI